MEKKRLDYLDMVKGVGIFFVVLGHIEYISNPLRVWISSYHMPLFFIVSGILMAVKSETAGDFNTSVTKKFKGIIIPYLWFSLAYFIIDIANVTIIKNIDMHTFWVDLISSATFYGMSVLWFLPALFLADIGFLFIQKKLGDRKTLVFLIIIALACYSIQRMVLNPLYDSNSDSLLITSLINFIRVFIRASIGMSFTGYAYYIHKLVVGFLPDFTAAPSVKSRILQFIFGTVMLLINIYLSTVNDAVDMHYIILNNVALYYIGAFLGCYGIILICKALPSVRLITYYGRNSLIVMACHVNFYILYASLRIALKIDQYTTHAKHYIFLAVTVFFVFLFSTVVIEGIHRFFPFVLGKPFVNPFKKSTNEA